MESSIAVFLMRQLACEQLPTMCGGAFRGGSPPGHLLCSPLRLCLHTATCSYRWLGKQAGQTASPRDGGVSHQLVIPSRPFGYDQV